MSDSMAGYGSSANARLPPGNNNQQPPAGSGAPFPHHTATPNRIERPTFLCPWCKGTVNENSRWPSRGAVIVHAMNSHYTADGKPTHHPHPFGYLFPIDSDKAIAANPNDVTATHDDFLLISKFNYPAELLYIDRPPSRRSKSHRDEEVPLLRKPDGTIATGPRGDQLRDLPIPDTIGSEVDDGFLECLFLKVPQLIVRDVLHRMVVVKKETALNGRRSKWREGGSPAGRAKNFLVRSSLSQSKEKQSKPLLLLLDSVLPIQLANNTVGDVVGDFITQPKPSSGFYGLLPNELWEPLRIPVYRNGTPHMPSVEVRNGMQVLQRGKAMAAERSTPGHPWRWSDLTIKELGLSGDNFTSGSTAGINPTSSSVSATPIFSSSSVAPMARPIFAQSTDRSSHMSNLESNTILVDNKFRGLAKGLDGHPSNRFEELGDVDQMEPSLEVLHKRKRSRANHQLQRESTRQSRSETMNDMSLLPDTMPPRQEVFGGNPYRPTSFELPAQGPRSMYEHRERVPGYAHSELSSQNQYNSNQYSEEQMQNARNWSNQNQQVSNDLLNPDIDQHIVPQLDANSSPPQYQVTTVEEFDRQGYHNLTREEKVDFHLRARERNLL